MTHNATRTRVRPLLVLFGLLLVAGCSTLPTAPIVQNPASNQANDAAVSDASDPTLLGGIGGIVGGVGGIVGGIGGTAGGLIPPVLEPVVSLTDTIIRSLPIQGGLGGTIENGKFTVTIPPGAIRGDAEVKVIVPDSTKLRCLLEITPATANGFEVPVTLRINASGQPHVERLGIAWFNPVTKEWEAVESHVDPATGQIEAPLPHFSEYRVQEALRSKAGW